ncbi:MAG: hypothetical protein O3A25_02175 [Acidobacteria bacterium]|nr:hypothetical protein [Acidobacteriota bacterium]
MALSLLLSADAPAQDQQTARAGGTFYVSAAAGVAGDGSQHAPFHSLSEAEASSQPGDTIYVLGNATGKTLDGGIALKPRQKLIGLGVDGEPPQRPSDRPRLTNSASLPGGIIVRLSEHNEVAGIHFTGMRNAAIAGDGATYSGTFIHHATFTGHADEHIEDERGLVYAVSFDTAAGEVGDVRVEDSTFADGEDLGAIRVFQSGESRGEYRFRGNDFSNLGGRAYFVRTQQRSRVETIILDSTADNIGRGDRNSDSIIPYLMGQSEQVMLIRNYRFNNTDQEGDASNTAIEAYMFGSPRPDEANWCTGCTLTLTILDSVIENAVTDPIQFSDSGTNSVLSYVIRNTRIVGGAPQQGAGGISVNLQDVPESGGRTTILVENTDVVGTTGYGFTLNGGSGGGGHAVTVDLGGGVLGSRGHNRFIDNAKGAMRLAPRRVAARHNWWGGDAPTVYDSSDRQIDDADVLLDPALASDPR